MDFFLTGVLICIFTVAKSAAFSGDFEDDFLDPAPSGECVPDPLGGVRWILSVQQSDRGWKEETHRAVIALAVSGWRRSASPDDIRQVDLQLEVELTKALMRNATSPLHPNDLALFVHALIASNRNPRNFYGIDLVSRLQIIGPQQVHPFLLLALCNGGALPPVKMTFAAWLQLNQLASAQSAEYLAMSLNAYECLKADSYKERDESKNDAVKRLLSGQHMDGSFGNVYTTSLIVQALSWYDAWDRQSAMDYLRRQSTVDVNMVSTYLIQLALNCDRVRFIRDLHPGLKLERLSSKEDATNYVQFTIRIGPQPKVFHTITLKVAKSSSLYDIMELSAKHDPKYNFSSYVDREGAPAIFSVSGVPNDAEENLYWRVCLQTQIDHTRHTSVMRTVNISPVKFVPEENSHIILWYIQSECEDNH